MVQGGCGTEPSRGARAVRHSTGTGTGRGTAVWGRRCRAWADRGPPGQTGMPPSCRPHLGHHCPIRKALLGGGCPPAVHSLGTPVPRCQGQNAPVCPAPRAPSTLPSVPSLTPAFASTLVPGGNKEGDKPPGDKPPPASSDSLAVHPSAGSAPGHPGNIVPAGWGQKSHPVRGRERLNTPVEGVQVPAEGLGTCQAPSCCPPSHCQGGRPGQGDVLPTASPG